MVKKFTLFDFPKDRVYIFLEKTFREKFFNEAIKIMGSQSALARELKVSSTMIGKWYAGKNRSQQKLCEQAIPLWVIIQIHNLINSPKFSVNKIQRAVIKYRAKGGWSVVKPNLPLTEDERLIRIFFHLAGDGFAGHFKGSEVNYFNKNREVMKEFIRDLSVFGKVKSSLKEGGYRLVFPKVIGHILQHFYQTNFKSEEVKLPSHFLKIKRETILQGIKALMDDEGHVECNRIRVGLKNKSFLEKIKQLLQAKTSIGDYIQVNQSQRIPTLQIASRGMKWYEKYIGFTHSQKRNDLNFYLKIKRNKRGLIGSTKIKILQSLFNREKTIKEISRDIKISPQVILFHIKGGRTYGCGLEKANLLCQVKNTSNRYIWKLTAKGMKILKNSQIKNNNLGLEKYLIGFWIYLNPGWNTAALSEFFGIDGSKIQKHLRIMWNKALIHKEGKGTRDNFYRFYLTKKGKRWIKKDLDYISTALGVINCLRGIGGGKILSLNSEGTRYLIKNFLKLKNKIC